MVRTNLGEAMGISEIFEARINEITKSYPLGRVGESEDIANAILFLASNDASFITGINLLADGGSLWTTSGPPRKT